MSVKIELSNDEARSLRDDWERQLLEHQGVADALMKKIAAIDAQLGGQLSLINTLQPTTGKRKKGENFRTIQSFLREIGPVGATVAEIHKRTALPISSCNAVLKRYPDIFAKGRDDLWRCRPQQ